MSKQVITLQPASFVDQVIDGREFYKKPYPLSIDADGYVQFQDFWQGTYFRVIGFQCDPDVYSIDLFWEDAFADPESIVGLYLVTSDDDGKWGTTPHPIESYWAGELNV